MERLDLACGRLRARMRPGLGASVETLDWRGDGGWQPVLAPDLDPSGKPPALASALFAMVRHCQRNLIG